MLSVTDTGCGMDTETQSHIFEPFYTTKKQGEGTGLGLSMVYGIIEQSGGSVRVESELFRGTTFKIYLPQAVSVSKPVMYRDEGIETPGGSETILLAEDEGVVRNLAYQILSRNGYRVLEAPNGTDALRTAIQHLGPIQLLVTDLVMPLMGGRDLAKRLRSLRPKTKVLYMSGYPDDSMFLNGGLDPCASIIQKPFSPDSFARKVREVLDGEKAVARGQ